MTLHEYDNEMTLETSVPVEDDQYSIPIDISDIISICKDFNSLGWQVQKRIEDILEVGVEESIRSGHVKPESLPHIKYFLRRVCDNAYFGDATIQARDCLGLIRQYEEKYQVHQFSKAN